MAAGVWGSGSASGDMEGIILKVSSAKGYVFFSLLLLNSNLTA